MAGRTQLAQVSFGPGAQPPPELGDAIVAAAGKFLRGIAQGPAILAGIWRVESGSKYPNPYANGLGYGGEFGTRMTAPFGSARDVRRIVEPPVTVQADTAARILADNIRSHNGDLGAALSAYSGGGYSSIPGVNVGPSGIPTPPFAPYGLTAQPPRPGVQGGGGLLGWIEDAGGGAAGAVGGVAGSAWDGVSGTVWGGIQSAWGQVNGVTDFLKAMLWLVNPLTWLRVVEAIFGFVLLLAGLLVLVKADQAVTAGGPVGAAARLAE